MKRTSLLKATSLIAALLMMGTSLVGCTSDSSSTESSGSESGSSKESSSTDAKDSKLGSGETVNFTATYSHFGGIPTEAPVHQEWQKQMDEKLGVTLDIKWNFIPYAEYAEKTNVLLASNDISDLHFIMDRKLTAPYEDQDMFVKLNDHIDQLPNYKKYIEDVQYGYEKISNGDGDFFAFFNGGLPRLSQGVGIYTNPVYRYDVFEENGIKIPETTEEFIDAAKKLKEIYPDKYPVSKSWADVSNLIYKTNDNIFYNGTEYQYGPTTENYKDMLKFKNTLFAEKLLDPESFNEDGDTHNKKALNGSNFISLGEWFQQAATWTNNEESDAVWVGALTPTDEKYGTAWQGVDNVNEKTLGGEGTYIKANAENLDVLLALNDEQYTDQTIRLITWGIEGTTYQIVDGKPTFVDSIKKAPNGWAEGDKYGMRASAKFRPGLQGPVDTLAFIDFAPNDNVYIDGKFTQIRQEVAFPNENWPDSKLIPPTVFAPPVTFTPDESQNNSNIMTAIDTYRSEEAMKFIKGEKSFDEWDKYVSTIEGMGLNDVVKLYNEKLVAFK